MPESIKPSNLATVAIIYAGGTIGMMPTDKGLAPAGNMAERLEVALAALPDERQSVLPQYNLITLTPLIDSSNAQPENWYQLAQLLWQLHDQYQGFVLLHGTDTLAYTASALSFLTQGFLKPIVVTGSQYPLEADGSDALNNVEGALLSAQQQVLQEVVVAFGGKLLRGNRCTKVSTYSHQAFSSPNAEALGYWQEGGLVVNKSQLLNTDQKGTGYLTTLRLNHLAYKECQIAVVKLHPGLPIMQLSALFSAPIQAVVLETFGSGNAPDQNKQLMQYLSDANQAGLVIVNLSQCAEGSVSMSYATGSALADCGIISAYDMTCEAAITKLHWLLQVCSTSNEIKKAFADIYCGEFHVS
ncbi:L-asparaginase [Oceanospirillum multiglobuliferum]|uniref:asparaginase n=1 Tax=Oceanospirillum multiglobuliferum TaxID=64969 RepID=A0A1T4SHH1_9GAMM|nr:asparaginase [Oceanospirillum multiglobuliferum]OPX54229.1 hypothetical protein BTE48_15295 [Oceanospirillum multiglobuliferum]SKA27639.1 L-asparaginase [Oceanospirillum multiglobuliferum]